MAIRLIDRMSRLVAADAHGLVESLEDRTLLLKQHLREAELELQHKRARIEEGGLGQGLAHLDCRERDVCRGSHDLGCKRFYRRRPGIASALRNIGRARRTGLGRVRGGLPTGRLLGGKI